jgi:hypothetical protein
MIHKNQSIKELPSRQPVQKDVRKQFSFESKNPEQGTSIIDFLRKRCRKRHLASQRETYSKPEKSVRCQKTAQKL